MKLKRKYALLLVCVLSVAAVVSLFLAICISMDSSQGTRIPPLAFVGIGLLVLSTALEEVCFKCPHCKEMVLTIRPSTKYCPYCGKCLDEA